MPTLLQINVVANWGSTGRIAEGIGLAAMAHGWQSYIAYGRGEPTSASKLITVGGRRSTFRNALKARLLDNEGLNARRETMRLIEQMKRIKPDVVHLHNIHGYYLNFPLLFQYLADMDIPVVWTLHDCWTFTGHCGSFDFVGCKRWKSGCYGCPQRHGYPASWLIDRSKRNYETKKHFFNLPRRLTLVPVSDWLAGLVRQSFLGGHQIQRIYNGVDLQKFKPSPQSTGEKVRSRLNIRAPHFILGVASVWTRRKGLDDFIALRKELAQEEFDIVLLGLPPKQIKQLPYGIIGVQRTNSVEEMAELYSAADVFVNPTWEDNFPTTNIEALACGTPVITYRTGGSPEAIDEKTGMVVEKGDIGRLAAAVKAIACKGRSSYAENCRQRAERLYNRDDNFEEYIRLYESL